MPGAGIEPAQCKAPRDFKSLASTNSATQAVKLNEFIYRLSPGMSNTISNVTFSYRGHRAAKPQPKAYCSPPATLEPQRAQREKGFYLSADRRFSPCGRRQKGKNILP